MIRQGMVLAKNEDGTFRIQDRTKQVNLQLITQDGLITNPQNKPCLIVSTNGLRSEEFAICINDTLPQQDMKPNDMLFSNEDSKIFFNKLEKKIVIETDECVMKVKKLTVEAQDIEIKGEGKLTLKGGDVEIDSQNLKLKGNGVEVDSQNLKLKGTASLDVTSLKTKVNGILEVDGALKNTALNMHVHDLVPNPSGGPPVITKPPLVPIG